VKKQAVFPGRADAILHSARAETLNFARELTSNMLCVRSAGMRTYSPLGALSTLRPGVGQS